MNSHPAQEYAIHTEALTRTYGEINALVDLDLSVPYGSIFAVDIVVDCSLGHTGTVTRRG